MPFDLAGAPFAEALRRVLDADQMPLGLTDADLRAFVEGRPLRLGDHPMRARRSIAPERRLLIASTAVAFIAGALTAYALFALLR